METCEFKQFQELVYRHSGINLGPSKDALVSARVGKRLRALGLNDSREYLKYLDEDKSGEEIVQLLDVISTNVTSFYREREHFDFTEQLLEEWLRKGQKRFRFWSAASSTGEEPYTLAMTIREVFKGADLDARILATDISTRVLAACREGLYRSDKVKPVPLPLRDRYFEVEGRGEDRQYRVRQTLRDLVTFRRLNLAAPPYPMAGPLDIVFCRNVMIYFDNSVRTALLNEVYRLLKPGGYLFVGHAESLTGMMSNLKLVRPSIYVKP